MKLIAILASLFFSVTALAAADFIKVGDFTIEYQVAGKGPHTIFLEAGASSPLTDWDPVFDELAEHAKVIRYSRVGNGNSTQIRRHFTSADYAGYAKELLDALNIKMPVFYIAHSYGGSVAREFAVLYPNRLKALMLVDASSEHDVDILRAIDLVQGNREIAEIKLDDMANGMSNTYLDFWSKRPLPDYPEIKDMPVTVLVSVKRHENPANLFFSDKGRELWGEHWLAWAKAFPQGKAVLTDKSGHFIQFDEPGLVIAEALSLLAKLKNNA